MLYSIKTLSQLPLLLKGFRKEKGVTQAIMAERLGITQQSYAHFEANPMTATMERLYVVLRLLDVEIGLSQTSPTRNASEVSLSVKLDKSSRAKANNKKLATRNTPAGKKKESW